MYLTKAYAVPAADAPFAPITIPRRDLEANDVRIDILFCGICHSDLHHARDEFHDFMPTHYPFVPGHEVVGRVADKGSAVTLHEIGDVVGVGCMVDADLTCPTCSDGEEQFCPNMVMTIGGKDPHGTTDTTQGGYSASIVVRDHFALKIPAALDPAAAAPLLCAGITSYSPMKRHGVGPGKKVGVVGLGGLGHMGIKFAHALGAHVVLFTHTPGKADDAKRLGADEVIVSTDSDAMQAHFGSFDMILDTVAASHDINPYLNLLGRDGSLVRVGISAEPMQVSTAGIMWMRRKLTSSNFGGIAETQEMLDFCGEHGIACDIETIQIQDLNEAYDRMQRGDVKYRFVIDMASLQTAEDAGG